MGKKSFVQTMKFLMKLQLTVVSILLIIVLVVSYMSAVRDTRSEQKNLLDIYSTQMTNQLEKINEQLAMVISENEDIGLLDHEDEAERHYAALRLSGLMGNIMNIDQSANMLVIAQPSSNICLDANDNVITYKEKNEIRDFFKEYAVNDDAPIGWNCGKIGSEFYIYKSSRMDGHAVAAVVSAKSLLNIVTDTDKQCFILTDSDQTICGYAGSDFFKSQNAETTGMPDTKWMMSSKIPLLDGKLYLYCYEKYGDVFGNLYGSTILIILITILLFVIDFIFMNVENRQLIYPMGEMVRDMEKMKQGDYKLRVQDKGNTREFSLLSQTFNGLMDEIMNLKIQYYEKKLALSDAEQKYIRLQIRPHFFLNAMTTIASLSAKGKNEQIDIYIKALSKNIRYMFSSGLHTVCLKDEIQHVENYFEMQELRYPDCLFYFISVPSELEEWRIPQMLIHTLIENEYKYAISQDSSLMVLIKASLVERSGEEMLLLEVEDDGQGYPEEVLEYMNHDSSKHKQDGSRVGLWSVKRLLELMYNREDLMEISNVQPHGALNKMYIPKTPVNERGKEYLDERGIQ